ncbi:MAG: hypothetical protein LBD36_01110 [Holosporales bacterium]|nr:hypothetical protein [Holosporales bacterium]
MSKSSNLKYAILLTICGNVNASTMTAIKDQLDVLSNKISCLAPVKAIFGNEELCSKIPQYVLSRILNILVQSDGDTHSITQLSSLLVKHPEYFGYLGAEIGNLTICGRRNEILYLITRSILLDKFGEYTNTAQQHGTTLWSRLKWIIETTDRLTQVEKAKTVLSDYYTVQYQSANELIVTIINLVADAQKLAEWGALSSVTTATADNLLTILEFIQNNNNQEQARASLSKLMSACKIYSALDASPFDIEAVSDEITNVGQSALVEYCNQLTRIDNAPEAYSQMNKVLGIDTDYYSIDPFTVCSLLRSISRYISGTVSMFSEGALITLAGQISTLECHFNDLRAAVVSAPCSLDNVFDALNAVYGTVAGLFNGVTIELPYENSRLQSTIASCNALVSDIATSEQVVDLSRIVNYLMSWVPLLADKASSSGGETLRNLYIGSYVSDGLTVMNCLHNVFKTKFIDPFLQKIGSNFTFAAPTSVFGMMKQIGNTSEFHTNKLILLRNMLGMYPVIGQFVVPTASTNETVAALISELPSLSPSEQLHMYINRIVGSRNDTLEKMTLFAAIKNNSPVAFNGLVDAINTVLFATMADAVYAFYPDKCIIRWDWFDYNALFAALYNTPEVNTFALDRRLYIDPLLNRLTGIPGITDQTSLAAKIQSLFAEPTETETDTEPAATDDSWFLYERTNCSVLDYTRRIVNYIHHIVSGNDNFLMKQTDLVFDVKNAIDGLVDFDATHMYETLTAPFVDRIRALLTQYTDSAGIFSGYFALLSKATAASNAIEFAVTEMLPVNIARILSNLQKIQLVTPADPASLGYSVNDHPYGASIYSLFNSILFECGAQLLLNFIGYTYDPANMKCKTFYSIVRETAKGAILETDSPDDVSVIELNAAALQKEFATLAGYLGYGYRKCVVGQDGTTFQSLNEIFCNIRSFLSRDLYDAIFENADSFAKYHQLLASAEALLK